MGREISFWECKYGEYGEEWDGEEETRYYECTHPKGNGICELKNKWYDSTDYCKLLKDD